MFRIVNSVRTAAKRTAMTARRNFASDAAPPQYEGAEAAVRKVLPKDEQIVAAYIGIIASIVLIAKMTGSKKEEPVAVVSGDATGPVDMVPSMFSDKFDEFISSPGGEEAFNKSCDEFEEWMKVPGNAAKYEAQFS
jgi:hypothetical protein